MNLSKNLASLILLALFVTLAGTSIRGEEKPTVINGYVLDSACAFTKNLKRPISRECALACANAGSPLVILGEEGSIYWPISEAMPATGQNQRLMRFAGEKVRARGKVFERGGSRALVIEHIETASTGR